MWVQLINTGEENSRTVSW